MPSSKVNSFAIEQVRNLFNYDPNSGKLTWKISPRYGINVGDEAGNAHPDGARRVMVKQVAYLYHRLCWAHHYGEWPKFFIDHINGDRADCRIENLRDVELEHNAHNTVKARRHNTTGFMGVTPSGKRFIAAIQVKKKARYLGTFDTPEEAHAAYVRAKREFLPEGRKNAL